MAGGIEGGLLMPRTGEVKAQETLDMLKRQLLKLRIRGGAEARINAAKLAGILESAVTAAEYWRQLAAETQERLEQERKYGYKMRGRNLDETEARGIAERIIIARKRKGMSQGELSMALHRAQGTVCKYERGRQVPSTETIRRMAEALGCTEDWLLGREKDENT